MIDAKTTVQRLPRIVAQGLNHLVAACAVVFILLAIEKLAPAWWATVARVFWR